jgi:Xaa-Pro dipeptidase
MRKRKTGKIMRQLPYLWDVQNGKPQFPKFSLAERDRRWARVRKLMEHAEIATLLIPSGSFGDEQANSRYLSQIGGQQGGAWVIFPLEGKVTAILNSERETNLWKQAQGWISDLRWGPASKHVVECLRELKPSGKVGVANLKGGYRFKDGVIPYTTWASIEAALPNIQFVTEDNIFDVARMVKGPEEVATIEKIVAANEAAIEVMFETARPGVSESTVWLKMAQALMDATGEIPQRLSIATNREAHDTNGMAWPAIIPNAGIMGQEISARLQGYQAQSNHLFCIGGPVPADHKAAMTLSCEIYQSLLEWLKPGRTIGELIAEASRLTAAHQAIISGMLVHTNGLGGDRPRLGHDTRMDGGSNTITDDNVVIEPGFTFNLKPSIRLTPEGNLGRFGDPLTVTDKGARRLGKRAIEPVFVG